MRKIIIKIIYIILFLKNYSQKSDLPYAYYLSLVESIIRRQKLRLSFRELRNSCAIFTSYREFLLTPGFTFAVNM